MSDDYCTPERRKNKGDRRAKARFMKYRKGGAQRVTGISYSGSANEETKN
jgi:hypothetical protein